MALNVFVGNAYRDAEAEHLIKRNVDNTKMFFHSTLERRGTHDLCAAKLLRCPTKTLGTSKNILVGVQALAWFYQTKVWTPFYESLYILF